MISNDWFEKRTKYVAARNQIIRQEPTLKTILNKIGDEIIVVNELLNKLELEIEYQEQTNSSLQVMIF